MILLLLGVYINNTSNCYSCSVLETKQNGSRKPICSYMSISKLLISIVFLEEMFIHESGQLCVYNYVKMLCQCIR